MTDTILNVKDVIIEYYKDINARFGFSSNFDLYEYKKIALLSNDVRVLAYILLNKYSRYSEYGISIYDMNDHIRIQIDSTYLKDEYKIIYKLNKDVLSSLILNDIGKN